MSAGWTSVSYRDCVSNEGSYQGSGLLASSGTGREGRKKGEAVVLVEGECERELNRMQR